MFGKNEIVGRKTFAIAPEGTLLVTSIFYTLQGEGPFAGRPAFFLRLAKCNLACSFCDTFFDIGDEMSFDSIFAKMKELAWSQSFPVGLVVTGGEPTLQPNLTKFLLLAVQSFDWVQVESNGTQNLTMTSSVDLVVSPKCSEKNGVPIHYLHPTLNNLDRAQYLKFVLSADPLSPYHTIPEWAFNWRRETGGRIYASPMNIYKRIPKKAQDVQWVAREVGVVPDLNMRSTIDEVVSFWEPGLLDHVANQLNHEHAGRYCLQTGVFLSLQQHLYVGMA